MKWHTEINKELTDLDRMILAIREHTEKIISGGKEACIKYINDVIIIHPESPQPETIDPERKWSDEDMINAYGKGRPDCSCNWKENCKKWLKDYKPTPSPEEGSNHFNIGDTVKCLFGNSGNKFWHKKLSGNLVIADIKRHTNIPDEILFTWGKDQYFYANDFELLPKPDGMQGEIPNYVYPGYLESQRGFQPPSNPPVRNAEEMVHGYIDNLDGEKVVFPTSAIDFAKKYHAQFKAPITEEEINEAARLYGWKPKWDKASEHFLEGIRWLQSHQTTPPTDSKDRSKEEILDFHLHSSGNVKKHFRAHYDRALISMQEYADQCVENYKKELRNGQTANI